VQLQDNVVAWLLPAGETSSTILQEQLLLLLLLHYASWHAAHLFAEL
jgi:hypothetical protein